MPNFSRILVTGSLGFIGRDFVKLLRQHDVEVCGIDTLPHSNATDSGYSHHTIDIRNRNSLLAIFSSFQPQALVHLAATTDVIGQDLDHYDANISGVENLVEAVRVTPSVKRAIYTSSQAVCRVGHTPTSNIDFSPITLYGESKVLTEKIVRREDGGGVSWCLTRPTTIWGPGMSPHYQRFFRLLRRGLYVHVGRAPLRKSYGYVGNTSHQMRQMLLAPHEAIHQQVFYLADYEPLDIVEWADRIQARLGASRIRAIPRSLARVGARAGDLINRLGFRRFPLNSFRLNNILTEYQVDLANTREVCGDLPYSVDDGVDALVSWLRTLP